MPTQTQFELLAAFRCACTFDFPLDRAMSQADYAAALKKARKQYTIEQKRWIVRRRLELQAKFDDKLHKNDQQWDYITVEYKAVFPHDAAREKTSLSYAVWDKEYSIFKNFCKTQASFLARLTLGLGTDQQESVLAAKQGIAHDIFLEFKVEERPIVQPPTLINAGRHGANTA